MMDFLRRLAPSHESDVTRAVAVLPSRFASERPLRATNLQARPTPHSEQDEAPLSLCADSASAAANVRATKPIPVSRVQPSQAASSSLVSGLTQRDNRKASSLSHAAAEAPDIDLADPRALQDRHGADPERARTVGPALQPPAATRAASLSLQGDVTALAQPRTALPLSQAILAQRTFQSRDDRQVVHVTIGRIEVVANTAPAPAVRRSPSPRQGTVTLADYLRGSHGDRQ